MKPFPKLWMLVILVQNVKECPIPINTGEEAALKDSSV